MTSRTHIQNPENNSYEIGDPTETLSQKTQSTKATAAEATSAAGRRASRATSAASTLEDTVNRHAENIIDHADMLYKIEADLVQIHAKCIEITATEKVTITTDKLEVNANGQIDVKAGGDINMSSGGLINLNDHVYLSDSGVVDNYRMYILGSSWIQELTIGGHLHIADIEDENGAKWTTQSLKDFLSMYSASFVYTGGSSNQYLEDAVKSFGTVVSSGGQISIPYYTFEGGSTKAGDITFNIADMAYYQDHIGIYQLALNGPVSQPYHEGEYKGRLTADRYYQVVATPNDGTAKKFYFLTPQSGSSSSVFERVSSLPSGKTATTLTSGYLYHYKYVRNGSTITDNYYRIP